jgi:predicted transcriptional regulator
MGKKYRGNPIISFRLKPEVLLKLNMKAQELRVTRSQLLKRALKNLIGD